MAQLTPDGIVKHRSMAEIIAPLPDPEPKTPSAEAPVVEEPKTELPEKYEGKTVAQVAEMHQNAEKELGRVRNEIGTYRGLVSDLSALNRTAPSQEPEVIEPVNVSGDDILRDPVTAVEAILKPHLERTEKSAEESRTQSLVAAEGKALMAAYPDLDATISTEDFQLFATRTPGRQADFNTAASGFGLDQVRAAQRLMEDYTDFQTLTQVEPKPDVIADPVAAAKAASTEGAGPSGPISNKPQIFESDVIAMINTDRAKYHSPSFQRELTEAISEGRYVKVGS